MSVQLVRSKGVNPAEDSLVTPSLCPGAVYQLPSGTRVKILTCTWVEGEEMVEFLVLERDFTIRLSVQNFRDTLKPKPV